MFKTLNNKKRIQLVSVFAVIGFLLAMIYTHKLWVSNNELPEFPRFDFIPIPSHPYDYMFAFSLVALLVLFIFKPNKFIGKAIVFLYVYLALVDQNRLQPFFYQSILTIFIVSHWRKSRKNTTIILHGLMLLFIATYFWSGVHKFNANFNLQWMHALKKHFSFIPEQLLQLFTYSVAFIEAVLGIFLLFNKTRKLAIIGIVAMHIMIVSMLFYLGYGYNVVPWNLQNILSVIVLFWTYKSTTDLDIFKQFFNYKKAFVMFMVFLLPFTNLFGFWDHLLSFSFFSSKLNYYYVQIEDNDLYEKLPEDIKQYTTYYKEKDLYILDLNGWSWRVNKVLFYPEDRVAKKAEKFIQSFAENPDKEGLTSLIEYNQRQKNK
jgi:hypothetical protein